MLDREHGRFSAVATSTFQKPAGRVLGCRIEDGTVTRGMPVTVTTPDGGEHRGVVVSLRHRWDDAASISVGEHLEFGMILEPSYLGPVPARLRG
jgi:translation initiation factor IF-2